MPEAKQDSTPTARPNLQLKLQPSEGYDASSLSANAVHWFRSIPDNVSHPFVSSKTKGGLPSPVILCLAVT
jgi:hypothetical protein